MTTPPGWHDDPDASLFTTVLTEDINSGAGHSYTAMCECGWEGLHRDVIPIRDAALDEAAEKARNDLAAHAAEEHRDAIP